MNKEGLKVLSVKELKAKCKDLGLTGYSRLSEDDLVQLILDQTPVDETDELDELLDGPTEDQIDEQLEDLDGDEDQTDTPEELGPEQSGPVTFKKKIKGAFGFNGQTFKGSTFELTGEEASHDKIKNAIKNGLIEIK